MEQIKILIADDHTLFRDGIRSLLEREQDMRCVAVAGDGEETLQLVKDLSPDVVLLDIAMPKMDGIAVAKEIRSTNPETAVLVLSAYKYKEYLVACIEAGVDGYLLKTIPRSQMVEAIRLVHAGETVFDRAFHDVMRALVATKNQERVSLGGLSKREMQVLELIAKGMANKQIGAELNISPRTVGTHTASILGKLGVASRIEAALYASKQDWVSTNHIGESER